MGLNKVPDFPSIWNVPYRHSPFFTGREDVLKQLHNALTNGKTAVLTQPQAISGLGGIGKTETVIEYAYRYQNEYQAVLWATADSREVLISDLVSIANLLDLPQKNEKDQSLVVNAVKRWLQSNGHWLLILDNVEDWDMVDRFLPALTKGSMLLTTRDTITEPTAQNVPIGKMETEEGVLFLLRRAKIIGVDDSLDKASEIDRHTAKKIDEMMDGLPLALDQAGAYILETKCGLSGYLERYEKRRADLLKHRGRRSIGHPESVTTTFSLSFEKVQQTNPASVELLRLCAFLHPDNISEEIITEGAPDLGPILQPVAANPFLLDQSIGELLKYSLVQRDSGSKTLNIHRLVQVVLKDGMDENTQQQWAEYTVRALNRTFPAIKFTTLPRCKRLLPHALLCKVIIEQQKMSFVEAARLLNQVGHYLYEYIQYTEVESLFQYALKTFEKVLGPQNLDVASSLSNLGALYCAQGKYTLAEPTLRRALRISEQMLGTQHPDVAKSLNTLGAIYNYQHRYTEAEPLLQRALSIREQMLGPTHPDVASSLNNLAFLYMMQDKYTLAEPMFRQALTIRQQIQEPEPLLVAQSLNNLGLLYKKQHKYALAEPLYRQSLAIRKQMLGPDHLNLSIDLNNLAVLYHSQGKYIQAESLYQQALAIFDKAFPEHPNAATTLQQYAHLLRETNRDDKAAELDARANAIRSKQAQAN